MMELLSPAGSPEALRAAAAAGADAVYLGWGGFNARQGAKNFSHEEFADALDFCRLRGIRVFLTLNTLLTDRELPAALDCAREASRLGVDAVLVQDWGLFSLIRGALPDLPVHASTQMSVFTSGGAETLRQRGCERIVLARECSREEVREICRRVPAEIEVFGHGALCQCYSGQCAFSAAVGGRSGNRGRCAQPCRLPYGFDKPPEGGHPLSLKDNCLAACLQEMEEMGVACLKLEGRMKRPEYVYTVTDIYARLLREGRKPTREELSALEQAFSRQGFTGGYWQGRRGREMFGSRPENVPPPKELFAKARQVYEGRGPGTIPVSFYCTLRRDRPAALEAADGQGRHVRVSGPRPEAARTRPLTAEAVFAQLAKTGGTPYCCREVQGDVEEGLSLPLSALNALRRDALAALTDLRMKRPSRRENPPPPLPAESPWTLPPAWTVSLFSREQLSPELLALGPARVYLPLEELESPLPPFGGEWCAVLPRVWRDRDEPSLREALARARDLGVTGVLLGNIGHFPLVEGLDLHRYGDYGLNVTNGYALAFLRELGLSSACLSFELRFAQLRDLPKVLPGEWIVYGRLPLMITENCLVKNGGGCPCGSAPHALVDRTGASFPLLRAYGCRTEVENSLPLWLAEREELSRLGLRYARLRFTTEPAAQCAEVFRAYLRRSPPKAPFTRGLYLRGVE